MYSQAFNGPQITEYGNAINLASNPAGAALGSVTVAMANYGPMSFTTPITFTVYSIGTGGVVGTELAQSQESVSVPSCSVASSTCFANGDSFVDVFDATFSDFVGSSVLPDTVVYGITLNGLDNSGNDSAAVGSLNVALGENVSAGSDVYPGDVYVQSLQADSSTSALGSNLGYCTGAPTGVLSIFQGVPVSCARGYGGQADGLGVDEIPQVEFTTVS